MDTTLVTDERETANQEEVAAEPKLPDVTTFKEIVGRHCRNWGASSVEGLCHDQTQTLIEELAQHFR